MEPYLHYALPHNTVPSKVHRSATDNPGILRVAGQAAKNDNQLGNTIVAKHSRRWALRSGRLFVNGRATPPIGANVCAGRCNVGRDVLLAKPREAAPVSPPTVSKQRSEATSFSCVPRRR
jgi:hypothetical protein